MLIAYQVALELVTELRPIVAALEKQDSNLADQLQRCATSAVLNLAEASVGKKATSTARTRLRTARRARCSAALIARKRGAGSRTIQPRERSASDCCACVGASRTASTSAEWPDVARPLGSRTS